VRLQLGRPDEPEQGRAAFLAVAVALAFVLVQGALVVLGQQVVDLRFQLQLAGGLPAAA